MVSCRFLTQCAVGRGCAIPLQNKDIKAVSIQWLSKHYDEIEEEPGMIVIDEEIGRASCRERV